MSPKKVNLVMIGHKDHGKSTLIGRLLYDSEAIPEQKLREIRKESRRQGARELKFSYLLDSLEEERKGGLTIDIMHTPFKTEKYLYTIIDCPGHREFVKNMITGASQAQAAILVISATEGIQDQTKQHTYLAKTLGIQQLLVAVNKMDQIDYHQRRFREVSESVQNFLTSLGFEEVPIIPLSALKGENVSQRSQKMPWYKGPTLIEGLDQNILPPQPPIDKPLRGFVQDVYHPDQGKIIICKVETGILEAGREIIFSPSGQEGRIKRMELFGEEVDKAEPGDSVGLLFDGVNYIGRGEVISYPENPAEVIEDFTAQLIVLTEVQIKNSDILTIRYGTAESRCRIEEILEKMDPINLTAQKRVPKRLKNGDVAKVVFSPLDPLCLERYSQFPPLGRFVVEGKKGTTAAGIVLKLRRPE